MGRGGRRARARLRWTSARPPRPRPRPRLLLSQRRAGVDAPSGAARVSTMGPRGAPPGWTRGAAAAVACLASRRHVRRPRGARRRFAAGAASTRWRTSRLVITHVDVISMPLAARIGGVMSVAWRRATRHAPQVVCKSPGAAGNSNALRCFTGVRRSHRARARIALARSPLVASPAVACSSHAPSPRRAGRAPVVSRGDASCDRGCGAWVPGGHDTPMRGSRPILSHFFAWFGRARRERVARARLCSPARTPPVARSPQWVAETWPHLRRFVAPGQRRLRGR